MAPLNTSAPECSTTDSGRIRQAFAIVVAYPYLPGSNTEAFKGVSVFVGLVVSLGSSGIVNQLMSGFMLTYSGALAPGEYVRIGDVEGTVSMLGVLSTKIRLNSCRSTTSGKLSVR